MEFDDGLPEGYSTGLARAYIGRAFAGVQRNVGGAGGTKLTLAVYGRGQDTDHQELYLEGKLQPDKEWGTICDSLTFVEYGELSCVTE